VKGSDPHIAEQIHDLLHHYDCVIVPELGGFVTDYRPAHIDKELNLLHPPSKELRFNNSLKKNDGLLANAIASAKEISHEEANSLLKESVESYFTQLNKGERVLFEKVGVLYLDSHERLRFHPYQSVNFLLDSFRLKTIHAKETEKVEIPLSPIVEEKVETPIVPITVMEEDVLPIIEVAEEEKKRRGYWVAAAVIPLFLLGAYAVMNSDAVPTMKNQLSELNPFNDSVAMHYTERSGSTEFEAPDMSPEPLEGSITLIESDGPIILKETNLEAAPESTYVAPPRPILLEYHVVGGCFSELANAEKFVKDLRAQGFDAYIFDNKEGLNRVVFGSYPDRGIALDALYAVKQEHQSDAWLLHKKP
jgi:hypothetical protein